MAVEIAYEKITGKPFDIGNMKNAGDCMALVYASMLVADPDTEITFDDLLTKASAQDIVTLKTAIFDAVEAWCKVPPTLTPERETEGDPKND